MSEFKYNETTRMEIWEQFNDCKNNLMFLSGIVQNEMPLNRDDLDEWLNKSNNLISELHIIRDKLINNKIPIV